MSTTTYDGTRVNPYTQGSLYGGFVEGAREGMELDLSGNITGPNLVATMYMPGFGTRVFAELVTISYQCFRELGTVHCNSSHLPRGIVRGPVTIAGSIVFYYFDRHALMDILSYTQNPGQILAEYQATLRQQEWMGLRKQLDYLLRTQDALDKNNLETVAALTQYGIRPISITGSDAALKDNLFGHNIEEMRFADGTTGVPSSENISSKIVQLEQQYKDAMVRLRSRSDSTVKNADWERFVGDMTPTSLPPFHVLLFGMNEAGVAIRAGIYNIHLQSDAATMSIDDLVTEGVCMYQATGVKPIENVAGPSANKQNMGISYLQSQVETLQMELANRVTYLRSIRERSSKMTPGWSNGAAVPARSSALVFTGALSLTYDLNTMQMFIEFPSQTQFNTPPIDSLVYADSELLQYTLIISPGEFAPKTTFDDAHVSVSRANTAEELIGNSIIITFDAQSNIELTGGDYSSAIESDLTVDLSRIDKIISDSSSRIQVMRTYRVSAMFTAQIPITDSTPQEPTLVKGYSTFIGSIKRATWPL